MANSNMTRGILQALAGALFGGVLSYLGAKAAINAAPDAHFEPIPLFLGLFLGLFLAIFVHELGHVAAGLAQGFRLYLFVVGPIRVTRVNDRLKLGLNKSANLAGGLAACLPSDNSRIARRMAIMTAGGPLASLLLGLGLWLLSRVTTGIPAQLTFLAAIISLAIAVATLLPWKSGNFNSDGARLQMYFSDPDAMSRWANSAALSGLCFSDVNPAQWPAPLVTAVRSQLNASYDGVGAAMVLYYHAIGTGDSRAGEYADHFLANQDEYPEPFRPALRLEGAYYEGAVRNQAVPARRWLDQSAGGVMIEPYTRLRAEAAVLLTEQRLPEVAAKAREAQALLAKAPANAIVQLERQLIESLLRRAESKDLN